MCFALKRIKNLDEMATTPAKGIIQNIDDLRSMVKDKAVINGLRASNLILNIFEKVICVIITEESVKMAINVVGPKSAQNICKSIRKDNVMI